MSLTPSHADRRPAVVVGLDEIEHQPGPGTLTWLPVRHTLDVRAFGCNAWIGAAEGDDVVEPHREASGGDAGPGQEELYFVARGHARFTIDGQTHEAPAGTYVFIPDPDSHRHAVAVHPGTTVLSFGGPPAFTPSAWEFAFRADNAMREPGGLSRARVILDDGFALHPGNPSLLYGLACVEALDGTPDAALARLGEAIEARPACAQWAREDVDFASLRGDARFAALTGDDSP